MKRIQLGLFLSVVILCLAGCKKDTPSCDKVTRLAHVKGTDLSSSPVDAPVLYDEQGRISQIDLVEKVIYEDNKVTFIYRSGNAVGILRSELTLKDGKPATTYCEYTNPEDPTSKEVFIISEGTFSQKGNTLLAEESTRKSSSGEAISKMYTEWIMDDTGHLKKQIRKSVKDGNEYSTSCTNFYDESHTCPDAATAFYVYMIGPLDIMLLLSDQFPGALKSMPTRFEMENAEWTTLDFANEYNAEGLCTRLVQKMGNETKTDLRFEYETVSME